ncbi:MULTISPECIES: DUF982 domain-containing protein [unclassified Rhizobium]|uniref:DUF982 domain-containing protein n=1 Tax=unclassified Rhizobium TaxID=2613769 RepID=UPI001ADC33F7|nr:MULTISPECIES: DUF982 domain-containing protein [unclassified Rhizobium]MBO9101706.1 DUF982 domain-containing protein [Rhizobium sp. L58/93]MBO9136436.1 DUF982 domain-containing protein [Rhizobium sp. B209b/85]MBO9172459.1 DUF982 domain-containing protein [Rhizobium sp. L245/93]MBO9187041.1 DUF982 domain-containing protein [Rhizobium sp. E27B/91]QXZ86123.1 DUF982 domain-containing protein [Rhizobium sp. K1/93]
MGMENSKWNVPVVLLPSAQIAKERMIFDARDAAQVLISEWPWMRGRHYDNALRACALVLGGFIEPDAART